MEPIISLCHATRRLPNGWRHAAWTWFDKCVHKDQVEYILCLDECDWEQRPSSWKFGECFEKFTVVKNTGRRCAVDAWNTTAQAARGKFLITVSDDWIPLIDGWDEEIIKTVPNLDGEFVLDVDNSDNSAFIMPFSLLTAAYLKRLISDHGYAGFFHPDYFGMQADSDYSFCAHQDGVVIKAKHLRFYHDNPERGDCEWDDTYLWQRREEAQETGKAVLERRIREGFGKCQLSEVKPS